MQSETSESLFIWMSSWNNNLENLIFGFFICICAWNHIQHKKSKSQNLISPSVQFCVVNAASHFSRYCNLLLVLVDFSNKQSQHKKPWWTLISKCPADDGQCSDLESTFAKSQPNSWLRGATLDFNSKCTSTWFINSNWAEQLSLFITCLNVDSISYLAGLQSDCHFTATLSYLSHNCHERRIWVG